MDSVSRSRPLIRINSFIAITSTIIIVEFDSLFVYWVILQFVFLNHGYS